MHNVKLSDLVFIEPDPVTRNDLNSKSLKLNFGFFFHSKRLSLGLSYYWYEKITDQQILYDFRRNLIFTSSCKFSIADILMIEPNLRLEFTRDITKHIAGVFTRVGDKLWSGFDYDFDRYNQFMIGYDFKSKFRVGYTYGFEYFLGKSFWDKHEFLLAYRIK